MLSDKELFTTSIYVKRMRYTTVFIDFNLLRRSNSSSEGSPEIKSTQHDTAVKCWDYNMHAEIQVYVSDNFSNYS